MTKTPIISVILPVYNAEKFVYQAIDSILKQSFTNFELLIINDGSSDNSLEIIGEFSDSRIKIINNTKNIGLIGTLNKGIKLSKGEFIARMDADDISLPERFKKQVDFFKENESIDILGASYEIFGFENKTVNLTREPNQLEIELFFHNCICHPSVMMRTQSIIQSNLKFENNFIHNEDWAFWLSALQKGLKIANLPDILLKYRSEGQNITVKHKNSVKSRFINLYTSFLPFLNIVDYELHWSIAHSQPQEYRISELIDQLKFTQNSLIKNGYDKILIENVLSKKKVKLFYKLTDQSTRRGLIFLFKTKTFNWRYFYYLLSKFFN